MRKLVAVVVLSVILVMGASPTHAVEEELTHGVGARAYAYKISVTKEVIQIDGQVPCDPETDPYGCDNQQYNQTLNCQPTIALGKGGLIPMAPPPGGTPRTGGAGDEAGQAPENREPPGASPVKLNELLAVGSISRAGSVLGSSGLASDTYVDQSGRSNPEAHSESDGFVANKNEYEERCDPATSTSSYVHPLTWSKETPEAFSFVECKGDDCSQSGAAGIPRPSARHALAAVHLSESGGKVTGKLRAFVSEMGGSQGANSLSVDYVATYVSFESDGTPEGMKWSAVTVASGVRINGVPVSLSQGQTVGTDAFFVGVAGPYVISKKDGTELKIYAPGMFYGTETQTTYVGGAELIAGLGRAPVFDFLSSPFANEGETISFTRPGPPAFGTNETAPAAGPEVPPEVTTGPEGPAFAVKEMSAGPWPLISLLAAGGLALTVLLFGWIQRFAWGRRLFEVQPLRSANWMYRAFVRT
ncbi:MAG: hypothetical protein KY429_02355 [Actinobacteria bacterium]|nr:hypothetical protein [Actinomycetota bacterium]